MQTKVVITGGPGTGKSTVIKYLEDKGYTCMQEVSRQITLNARKKGIEQLFITNPIEFSNQILEERVKQFTQANANSKKLIFFDRGIPDVSAYLDFNHTNIPEHYHQKNKLYKYNYVFLMPPWKNIYSSDNERYENFEQTKIIHKYLKKTYLNLGYTPIKVPKLSIEKRANFILNILS